MAAKKAMDDVPNLEREAISMHSELDDEVVDFGLEGEDKDNKGTEKTGENALAEVVRDMNKDTGSVVKRQKSGNISVLKETVITSPSL